MKTFSQNEINRILFVINRDGIDSAILFAKQTIRIYRSGVLRTRKKYPHGWSHLSLTEYKKHAIVSYMQLRHFINNIDCYKELHNNSLPSINL